MFYKRVNNYRQLKIVHAGKYVPHFIKTALNSHAYPNTFSWKRQKHEEEIGNMKKYYFQKLVNKKVKEAATKYLIDLK